MLWFRRQEGGTAATYSSAAEAAAPQSPTWLDSAAAAQVASRPQIRWCALNRLLAYFYTVWSTARDNVDDAWKRVHNDETIALYYIKHPQTTNQPGSCSVATISGWWHGYIWMSKMYNDLIWPLIWLLYLDSRVLAATKVKEAWIKSFLLCNWRYTRQRLVSLHMLGKGIASAGRGSS